MSSVAIALLLMVQAASASPRQMLVTPEGLHIAASSRPQNHARQIEVVQQLWREVCIDRRYGACAAPGRYVVDVDVDEETPYHCAGSMRLARTAPEYPSEADSLPGVQFHCFGAGPEAERRILTINLPDADSGYLDWPPMPEIF